MELQAGEYKVKVEGSNVVFMNLDRSQKFTVPVKIENTRKEHDYTAIESNKQNGEDNIQAIELGGSDETLEFGD